MNHQTHVNFTRLFFPGLKSREIERITSVIDSPSRASKQFNQLVGSTMAPDPKTGKMKETNSYDVWGLGKGHRRVNHDMVTAGTMTYLEVGAKALGPTALHLLLDTVSEDIKHKHGRTKRDLWEAAINDRLEEVIKADKPRYYYQRPKKTKPIKPYALMLAHMDKTKPYYR